MSTIVIDQFIERLSICDQLQPIEVKYLCFKVREIFIDEPNLIEISAPVNIIGDINGNLYNLVEILNSCGKCENQNYIFLGNYINYGLNSIETILLLIAYKIKYPDKLIILRGNNESRQASFEKGMYEECIRSYSSTIVWNYICNLFDFLPIAALVDNKILCIHSGLQEQITSLNDV